MPAEAATDIFSMILSGGGGVGGGVVGLYAIQKLFLGGKEPNGKIDKVIENGLLKDEVVIEFRTLHANHQRVLEELGGKLDEHQTEAKSQTALLRNMDSNITTFVAVMKDRNQRS